MSSLVPSLCPLRLRAELRFMTALSRIPSGDLRRGITVRLWCRRSIELLRYQLHRHRAGLVRSTGESVLETVIEQFENACFTNVVLVLVYRPAMFGKSESIELFLSICVLELCSYVCFRRCFLSLDISEDHVAFI